MKKFVAYFRVSTRQQEVSGLGLEAQRASVTRYVEAVGGTLVAPPFTEIEYGTHNERPELAKAIARAKRLKATLLVARLDRLSRNVAFIAALMDSKTDFVACDNPTATPLTVHILAAVAEEEAKAISIRTKCALQAAKSRGTLLGSSRPGHWDTREDRRAAGQKEATKRAALIKRKQYEEQAGEVLPLVEALAGKGYSLTRIQKHMEENEILTPTGGPWYPMLISRLLNRAKGRTKKQQI